MYWESGVELNYLDVTFNIQDDAYKPYSKPMALNKYVNPKSDQPRTIIREILRIVED